MRSAALIASHNCGCCRVAYSCSGAHYLVVPLQLFDGLTLEELEQLQTEILQYQELVGENGWVGVWMDGECYSFQPQALTLLRIVVY